MGKWKRKILRTFLAFSLALSGLHLLFSLDLDPPLPVIVESTSQFLSSSLKANEDRDVSDSSHQCPPAPISIRDPLFHAAETATPHLRISEENAAPLCRPATPLLIPFTSNFCLLQQTILSYIAEGWPSSQIIVIDNTGMAELNVQRILNFENHSFLDYSLLLRSYGVHIYRTPTRLTLSQLQNLMLSLAREEGWSDFYQSHQDIVVRSRLPKNATEPYRSFYQRVLQEHSEVRAKYGPTEWGLGFFHSDWLSHVNVLAANKIGPWDVLIPYSPADCDYYSRTRLKGFKIFDFDAGDIYDVATCLDEVEDHLVDFLFSSDHRALTDRTLLAMEWEKRKGRGKGNGLERHDNTWQGRLYDGSLANDFGPMFQSLVEVGKKNYRLKWRTDQCDPLVKPKTTYQRWSESWGLSVAT